MNSLKFFFVGCYAQFVSVFRNHCSIIQGARKILFFFRRLKLPLYKDIYDWLNFYSYYPVLKKVLMQRLGGVYFEWGPGINTELANKTMRKVYSVELVGAT